MIRTILLTLAALSPWPVRRLLLRWLCNASFGPGAYVGASFVDTQRLTLGEGARIGSLNCVRHVREVALGSKAALGNLNWLSGASHKTGRDTRGNYTSGRLLLQDGAQITNRHYIDLHGDIEIGRFALVAGVRSTLFTHAIDFSVNRQTVAGISIGEYTFIATNVLILPGTQIPEKCIVAAGGVVKGRLAETGWIYGGVPARKLKAIPADTPFFTRLEPFVE